MAGVTAGLLYQVGECPADAGSGAARLRPGEGCPEVGAPVEQRVHPLDGFPVAGDDVGDAVLRRGVERRLLLTDTDSGAVPCALVTNGAKAPSATLLDSARTELSSWTATEFGQADGPVQPAGT